MVSRSIGKAKAHMSGVQSDMQPVKVNTKDKTSNFFWHISKHFFVLGFYIYAHGYNFIIKCFISLCSSGFVVLSTFVPTHGTCSVVLCLVHYCLLTTFFAELLSHIDYYIAIVWPFFHEEHFGVEDRTLKMCVLTAMGKYILFYTL